jgi:hypothetical protein
MKEDKYLCSGSECILDIEYVEEGKYKFSKIRIRNCKKYNEDVKHIKED